MGSNADVVSTLAAAESIRDVDATGDEEVARMEIRLLTGIGYHPRVGRLEKDVMIVQDYVIAIGRDPIVVNELIANLWQY